ncbi:aldo/keto reductase [Annulohypoxylon maeteangense]|uniref:aldo/keto reductase n=1 Tax=Annulohypoxylon maeteangense TaxID=1927788 RepID=UPI002008D495|nr:aldo/keto reductase [Annulohypoxylon maeteangense]KAI0888443.1 aldo/keto reductase [Annulohypoxylon maeteangense]
MAGHVNMMDDCLISNLPPATLRSALRLLVSQGSSTQRPFVEHIRTKFFESPPKFEPPERLFSDDDVVTSECLAYLAQTRCIFSCKLAQESLPYLDHFMKAIPQSGVKWTETSALCQTLQNFDGDIVQAVQALKESRPEATPELLTLLQNLVTSIEDCRNYCHGPSPLPFTFTRALRQLRDVIQILFPSHPGPETARESEGLAVVVDASKVETFELGPFRVPRLFNGLWQMSSPSWGAAGGRAQEKALVDAVACGLTAADMADHYGDAELIFGDFRISLVPGVRDTVFAATKWCVFSPISTPITTLLVLDAVRERCRRLRGRVELLQFHWQDYESKQYLDILVELIRITKSHPELVSTIGLCNFDSEHTEECCEYLLAKTGEVGIVSNQVQFSLVDSRPLHKMVHVCEKYGLKLLTYGSFCGGFLSSQWLGQPAPEVYLESNQLTPSQRKYFDMIQTWGPWPLFQALLTILSTIASKHNVSISNIATRWVLQKPSVGAVIVGTRLGVSTHVSENERVFEFTLDEADVSAIDAVALGVRGERSLALYERLGDCGGEYRGVH